MKDEEIKQKLGEICDADIRSREKWLEYAVDELGGLLTTARIEELERVEEEMAISSQITPPFIANHIATRLKELRGK